MTDDPNVLCCALSADLSIHLILCSQEKSADFKTRMTLRDEEIEAIEQPDYPQKRALLIGFVGYFFGLGAFFL